MDPEHDEDGEDGEENDGNADDYYGQVVVIRFLTTPLKTQW